MDVGDGKNNVNGDKPLSTSGQIIMASTESESVAKLTPPRDDTEVNLPADVKIDIVTQKTEATDSVKKGSEPETDGVSSGAWPPLPHMQGDSIAGSSSLNPSVVTIPKEVSSPIGAPSTTLQNLDDFKGMKKPSTGLSLKTTDDMVQPSPKQSTEKVSSNVAMNDSSLSLGDSGDPEELKRKKKDKDAKFKIGKDFYCWICHKDKANVSCGKCPRSYHPKCLLSSGFQHSSLSGNGRKGSTSHDVTCPECKSIEDLERRPPKALKTVTKEELNSLLSYAVDSIKPTADPSFHAPVSKSAFPDYFENVIHPTDFHSIEEKIKNNQYTSTQAFLSDMRWIVHNCCIYNNHTHPLTSNAKSFMKLMVTKIVDLEICPDCFKNYHVKPKTWFSEVCRKPHALVWAKVVGHPFWPGKVVQIEQVKKEADVRFFGAHDRAWLPIDQCFLITENNCKSKSKSSRSKFDVALKELNEHISKIETKLNIKFPYSDQPKVPVDAKKPFVRAPKKECEVSSEEEEEEDFLDDIDGPGLQIDESVKEPMDDEPDSPAKGHVENGEVSEAEVSTPQNQKSARKRKLNSTKSVDSEAPKGKKAPVTKDTHIDTDLVKPIPSPTPEPKDLISDPTPLDDKDIPTLRKEVERLRSMVQEEKQKCIELLKQEKKKSEIAISDAKKEFAKEKERAVRETRSRLEATHEIAIAETKKQQWCAQCAHPAVYYCCWNTSYCSYDCQNNHWQHHMNTCQQSRQTQQQNNIR